MNSLHLLLPLLAFTIWIHAGAKQTYIVHVDPMLKPTWHPTHTDWYSAALLYATGSSELEPTSLLYSYSSSFPGFAATLEDHEVDELMNVDGVVDVYEDKLYTLLTTRSPEFLGLESTYFEDFSVEIDTASHDVIIGVVDSGVWPESKSFDDTGMPPVPSRWKGECESAPDFSPELCNRKLIGARVFGNGYVASFGSENGTILGEYLTPRDLDGHGTHTSTTAAGSEVRNASLFGYARGTARGMAPQARLASYRVCFDIGCFNSDILAAVDRAIEDGVDVLSISLGGGPSTFYCDPMAISLLEAVRKGIFVACSAGNDGPDYGSVSNLAPWIMTVGAGTIDRTFPAYVSLGGGKINLTGVSTYSGPGMGTKPIRLVYFKEANTSSNLCFAGTLKPRLVRGNVVLCDRGISPRTKKADVVKKAGGVGMILADAADNGEELLADSNLIPSLLVGKKAGDKIRAYVEADPHPTALISFGGTVLNVKPAPVVAAFSSRGPNTLTPQILKPDVIGPGVNILAGWSLNSGPTGRKDDKRKTDFNIMSGTSMACPHIAGLASLIKAVHPTWSPSAIKSALMTTAYDVDNTGLPIRDVVNGLLSTPFAQGAGYVSPRRALSPGLIYETSASDYVAFLCSLNYTVAQVKRVAGLHNVRCSGKVRDPGHLNYPSFSVVFGKRRAVTYTREVTNVGDAESVYDVVVTVPKAVHVTVVPESLVFKNVGEKQTYTVTFVADKGVKPKHGYDFGSLTWKNARHLVRSPIAFTYNYPSFYNATSHFGNS